MRYRKVKQILRYHVPNKPLSPEKLTHHVMLLFHPFRDEKELFSAIAHMQQNKPQEEGTQDVVDISKFEPYLV